MENNKKPPIRCKNCGEIVSRIDIEKNLEIEDRDGVFEFICVLMITPIGLFLTTLLVACIGAYISIFL